MYLQLTRDELYTAMDCAATKNRNRFKDFWDEILDAHKQNDFFTLERVEEAIKMIHGDKMFLSNELVLALILQHFHFSPFDKDGRNRSATFAEETLLNKFGWESYQAAAVGSLIRFNRKMVCPDDDERFYFRLMYDFKMLRLGLPWEQFLENMEMVRKEYTAMTEKEFIETELAIFRHHQCQDHLFAIHTIRERFEKTAKENVSRYIVSLDIQKQQLEESERVASNHY